MNHLQCTVCGQWLTALIWNVLPYRYLFLMYCSVLSVVLVVGVAKHIDWFGPSGDRIEPNRQDTTVTRNDESSSTLTLYKAGTESAGTYKCVAINGDQQAESTVKVKIFRKSPPHRPTPQYTVHTPNYWVVWTQKKKNPAHWTHSILLTAQGQHIILSFQVRMDFSSVQ